MNIRSILKTTLILCLAVVFFGCSHIPKKTTVPSSPDDGVVGRVLDSASLRQGGKILIIPFTAGEGVAATDDLDKISLRLVRGLSVALEGQQKFVVLSGDKAQDADFVIKGRIVRVKEKKGMPQFLKARTAMRYLSVEGEVVARKGSQTLAYFSNEAKNRDQSEKLEIMAERLGTNIGEFILKAIQ